MNTLTEVAPLVAADRCDQCGARALVRVTMRSTSHDLLFCAHHYTDHEHVLLALDVLVQDERALATGDDR